MSKESRAAKKKARELADEAKRLSIEEKWIAKRSDLITEMNSAGHRLTFSTYWAGGGEGGHYKTKMLCVRRKTRHWGRLFSRWYGLSQKRVCQPESVEHRWHRFWRGPPRPLD